MITFHAILPHLVNLVIYFLLEEWLFINTITIFTLLRSLNIHCMRKSNQLETPLASLFSEFKDTCDHKVPLR